ncbi:MAG TPA: peptidoglycan recognition family protein [Candidatus Saccharimonadales bacterium]
MTPAAALAADSTTSRAQAFASAAQEFQVPEEVLLALSYNESRWEAPGGMSGDGGYGLFDLRTQQPQMPSGSGLGKMTTTQTEPTGFYTLNTAASLLHVSKSDLETNGTDNIRGAGAVLAQYEKQINNNALPTSVNNWYGALEEFSGATNVQMAQNFADAVFATMKSGAAMTTDDGQTITLAAMPNLIPNKNVTVPGITASANPASTPSAECPSSLKCSFMPAAYAPDSSTDPTNYGNYDLANRPTDNMKIKYIFIHDMEGSYQGSIAWFQNPAAYASANYMVSSTGAVTQMVLNQNISWGVYNWYDNMHGINIENEGFAARGAKWFTPAMYQTDATLIRWLAAKYNIPLDRQHILGHDNIPTLLASEMPNQHWDPGPFWNWSYLMDLVLGEPTNISSTTTENVQPIKVGDVVTISPNFATNKPVVTDCSTGTCKTLPSQGANFVYLYTKPNTASALLTDPYVHTDGSPGTTEDDDWGDKASTGAEYVVAKVQGSWTGIYYAGQIGWFYNPTGKGSTATVTQSATITPRAGLSSIPIYGAAYPEASAYPKAIPVPELDALYTIPAGEVYPTTGENLPTDYYNAVTYNYSAPDDHFLVIGHQQYYQIWYNHRIAYVRAADVQVGKSS